MICLLDTDTLTHLHRGHPNVGRRLGQVDPSDRCATTVITRVELLRGRFDHLLKGGTGAEIQRAQGLLSATEELLAELEVVPFDAGAAARFDQLRAQKSLARIGRNDLLIASIALARGACLVTRNTRHFRPIPGLVVQNWVD